MTRANVLVSNFTAGEFSPRLWAREDLDKYGNAARKIFNMIVTAHGGAKKRPGTRYMVEMPNAVDDVRLIPFQYNVEQSYVLIFGDGFIWFARDQGMLVDVQKNISGITQTNPAVVTSTAHGFSNGEKVYITGVQGMAEVNNQLYVVANKTTDTFELTGVDATGYAAYSSGGQASQFVELATGFSEAELENLRFAQSADVLYVSHPDHSPKKITRTSDTVWTLSELGAELGPFRQINDDETATITFNGWSAGATAYGTHNVGDTANMNGTGLFTADMVGGLWRLKEAGDETGLMSAPLGDSTTSISVGDTYTNEGRVYGVAALSGFADWGDITRVPAHKSGTVRVKQGANYFDSAYLHDLTCVVKVLSYVNANRVTVQVVNNHLPASVVTSGTTYWQEGAWSDARGWPREVTLFEQRLWFASTNGDPQTLWGSRSAAYEDFQDGADDDDAVTYALASGEVDVVRWLKGGRVLTAGTSSGEYAISASSQNEALTPSNVSAKMQTAFGSSASRPIELGQIVLFPQRNGDPDNYARKVREFSYNFQNDAFEATNLTIFSEHITGAGVIELTRQMEPENVIWGCRTDGMLIGMTYEPDQNVIAWHGHTLGGTNAQVKRLASIPGDEGDDVYMVVDRTVSGTTHRMVEVMQPYYGEEASEIADAWFLDAALDYSGSETDSLAGLSHLEGEEVGIWNNGSFETSTVVNGRVNLPTATTRCTIGLLYNSQIDSMGVTGGEKAGTSQTRKRHINKIGVRLLSSSGGDVGINGETTAPIYYRTPDNPMDASPPLFSGWKMLNIGSAWDRDIYVTIKHSEPSPFFVTGLVVETNVTG